MCGRVGLSCAGALVAQSWRVEEEVDLFIVAQGLFESDVDAGGCWSCTRPCWWSCIIAVRVLPVAKLIKKAAVESSYGSRTCSLKDAVVSSIERHV